jgi:hypothetical protein
MPNKKLPTDHNPHYRITHITHIPPLQAILTSVVNLGGNFSTVTVKNPS